MKLEIERREGGITVRCGDSYEELDCGEVLWCVAKFLAGASVIPFLRTKQQHEEWERKYFPKPLEPWQRQLTEGKS